MTTFVASLVGFPFEVLRIGYNQSSVGLANQPSMMQTLITDI